MNRKLNSTRILVGLILITILSIILFRFVNEIRTFDEYYGRKLTFSLASKLVFNARTFIRPIIISIALIGIFIPKKIGWVLVNQIFVYAICFVVFVVMPSVDKVFIPILICLFPIGLFILMHGKKTLNYYRIEKNDLLTWNLISVVFGMGAAFVNSYFMLHVGKSLYEILYN